MEWPNNGRQMAAAGVLTGMGMESTLFDGLIGAEVIGRNLAQVDDDGFARAGEPPYAADAPWPRQLAA